MSVTPDIVIKQEEYGEMTSQNHDFSLSAEVTEQEAKTHNTISSQPMKDEPDPKMVPNQAKKFVCRSGCGKSFKWRASRNHHEKFCSKSGPKVQVEPVQCTKCPV